MTLLSGTSTRAHKAGWYQKWSQRRLRPEEFGARVHSNMNGATSYPISDELSPDKTDVFSELKRRYGAETYLLPQAFPEGCPTHPAYPSGHATVAGASVTILKALFNESHPLTGPRVRINAYVPDPSTDGDSLIELDDVELFVGGELNKLASNIATFREMSGVHWRSDGVQGILLGEQVALKILIEQTSKAPGPDDLILPFYRERKRGRPGAEFDGAPFFRLTLFSREAIDIIDGEVFRVENAFRPDGSYNPQQSWRRTTQRLTFEDLVRLQGFPQYG